MDVRVCRGCGKLFNYTGYGTAFCPDCRDGLEAKFQEVKNYIWEHKGVNIVTVSEVCDVEEVQIREWIKEGRLEFSPGAANITCEKCGAPILGGRFCNNCKNALVSGLNSAMGSPKPAKDDRRPDGDGPKMRFL